MGEARTGGRRTEIQRSTTHMRIKMSKRINGPQQSSLWCHKIANVTGRRSRMIPIEARSGGRRTEIQRSTTPSLGTAVDFSAMQKTHRDTERELCTHSV